MCQNTVTRPHGADKFADIRFVLETLTGRSSQHSAVLRANAKAQASIAAALRPVSRTAALSEALFSAPSGARSAKDRFRYQRD
jgi:hypothetical protein